MAQKLQPYRVLAPRVTETHIEQALLDAWKEGYELKFIIPDSGPRGMNVFLIMTPRKGK
jgi:hypothetical protein